MTNSSLGIQLGHLLQIDANAFAIKQYKVNVLQGGVGGGHKMVGDGLQGELSRHLLWESVSVGEIHGKTKSNKIKDGVFCSPAEHQPMCTHV